MVAALGFLLMIIGACGIAQLAISGFIMFIVGIALLASVKAFIFQKNNSKIKSHISGR